MRVKYEDDMTHMIKFTDLKNGTPFQFLDSVILFLKHDDGHAIDLSNGQVESLGTVDEFLYVNPRLDAVVTFEKCVP